MKMQSMICATKFLRQKEISLSISEMYMATFQMTLNATFVKRHFKIRAPWQHILIVYTRNWKDLDRVKCIQCEKTFASKDSIETYWIGENQIKQV